MQRFLVLSFPGIRKLIVAPPPKCNDFATIPDQKQNEVEWHSTNVPYNSHNKVIQM